MLNPQKIWHEHLTDLSISPVTCSHFTLRNPKSHFSTLLFLYFRLLTLPQKKTNSNCCNAALAVYLLLFSASYYLHSQNTASGERYMRSAYGHAAACGSGLLQHGLNFSTTWCTMRLISVEKDWKYVLTQEVVTVNTCCDTVCLTF